MSRGLASGQLGSSQYVLQSNRAAPSLEAGCFGSISQRLVAFCHHLPLLPAELAPQLLSPASQGIKEHGGGAVVQRRQAAHQGRHVGGRQGVNVLHDVAAHLVQQHLLAAVNGTWESVSAVSKNRWANPKPAKRQVAPSCTRGSPMVPKPADCGTHLAPRRPQWCTACASRVGSKRCRPASSMSAGGTSTQGLMGERHGRLGTLDGRAAWKRCPNRNCTIVLLTH